MRQYTARLWGMAAIPSTAQVIGLALFIDAVLNQSMPYMK